jgi:hypothetical protein
MEESRFMGPQKYVTYLKRLKDDIGFGLEKRVPTDGPLTLGGSIWAGEER